jgi:hypothetical protein
VKPSPVFANILETVMRAVEALLGATVGLQSLLVVVGHVHAFFGMLVAGFGGVRAGVHLVLVEVNQPAILGEPFAGLGVQVGGV